MAQRVGPFSSFFLKQNASLISDEVEVVQQARGIFFWGVKTAACFKGPMLLMQSDLYFLWNCLA